MLHPLGHGSPPAGNSRIWQATGAADSWRGSVREIACHQLADAIKSKPYLFNMTKSRFAMDWFYPILAGAITVGISQAWIVIRQKPQLFDFQLCQKCGFTYVSCPH